MPESVKRRGSSGPTIGAMVGFSCFGSVAMGCRQDKARSFRRAPLSLGWHTDTVRLDKRNCAMAGGGGRGIGEAEGAAGRPRGGCCRDRGARSDAGAGRGDRAALAPSRWARGRVQLAARGPCAGALVRPRAHAGALPPGGGPGRGGGGRVFVAPGGAARCRGDAEPLVPTRRTISSMEVTVLLFA